jgi:hypothetical protein
MFQRMLLIISCLLLTSSVAIAQTQGSVPAEAHGKTTTLKCSSGTVIQVKSAIYGENQGVTTSVLKKLASSCDNLEVCDYPINVQTLGDPAPNKAKNFVYSYNCVAKGETNYANLMPEASGKTLSIRCPVGSSIQQIKSSKYGGNCTSNPKDVTSILATACNKQPSCSYKVSHAKLGDPAPGCAKDFTASFICTKTNTLFGWSIDSAGKVMKGNVVLVASGAIKIYLKSKAGENNIAFIVMTEGTTKENITSGHYYYDKLGELIRLKEFEGQPYYKTSYLYESFVTANSLGATLLKP